MNPAKCRDLRHAWEHVSDEITEKSKRRQVISFKRILECTRCQTQRIDEFKVVGTTLVRRKTKYDYPEGYGLPKGMTLNEIRFNLFKSGDM